MGRSQIEVSTDTRDALKDARIYIYADAGQVLNTDGLLLFLLGVWRHVRLTELGAEACQISGQHLAQTGGVSRQGCRG